MTSAVSPNSPVTEAPQPSLPAGSAGATAGGTVSNLVSTKSTLTSLAGTETEPAKPKDKVEGKVEQSKSSHDHPVYQKIVAKAKELGFTSEQIASIRCEKINGRTLIFVGMNHFSENVPFTECLLQLATDDCVEFHEAQVGEMAKNHFGLEEDRLNVLCALLYLNAVPFETKWTRKDGHDLTGFENRLRSFIHDLARDGYLSEIFQKNAKANLAIKCLVEQFVEATTLDFKFDFFAKALRAPKMGQAFYEMIKKLATHALNEADLDKREKVLVQLALTAPDKHMQNLEPILVTKRAANHAQVIAKVMKERPKAIGIVLTGDVHTPGHIRELQKLL